LHATNKTMRLSSNFHLRFILFTAAISIFIAILQWTLPMVIHYKIWNILIFVAIMSYVIGLISILLLKGSTENLIQIKLLGMVLRILASLSYIGIMVFMGMEHILLFVSDFFVIFLFYLFFDIYTFLANLRPISK